MFLFKTKPRWWIALALGVWLWPFGAGWAAPVTAETAARMVRGWLRQDRSPLGGQLSSKIKRTDAVNEPAGGTIYYVVRLEPSGYVIVSADDRAEPVVAFSSAGNFDAASASPVAAMVNYDFTRRLSRARALVGGKSKAQAKWDAFLAGSDTLPPDAGGNGSVVVASQIWVAPLVQTLWNQELDVSLTKACYNYFTPPGPNGATNNYPCGCVATAMAQELYYFRYPSAGLGNASFTVTVDGSPQVESLLGGPYQWTNMPLSPNNPTTAQAAAIGTLTHDTGVAVQMFYTPTNSQALTGSIPVALSNPFLYGNTAYYENDNDGIAGSNLVAMINPNLDARLPVIIGIEPNGGHCVLVDGYGYSSSTLYHHINAGFGGDDDVWYALPGIDTADGNGDYTTVVACVYNIFTNGGGQIISGRVTDPTGAPVAGATVTATHSSSSFTATTDSNGVYALAKIPANTSYTLTASYPGIVTASATYSTGGSIYGLLPSGNVWGANFVLTPSLLAVPETGFDSIGPAGGPFSPEAAIYALENKSASALSWNLSNTNAWLGASSSNGTVAAGAAFDLTVALSPAAASLAAGTYSGTIWITNQNNGLAQPLAFSLSVNAADYPIAVTGYNLDVVVENSAVGGSTANYAAGFDPQYEGIKPAGPVCFYEAGLVATNLFSNSGFAARGLPSDRTITSLADNATTFEFAPYESSNVLCLTESAPSGSLALVSPMACQSLSILAASTQGGGNGAMVINFADGSSSTNIPFSAPNYLVTNNPATNAAITNFGLLATGYLDQFYSLDPIDASYPYPTLYQTTVNLAASGYDAKPINSVSFTMPNGVGTASNTATGIFAVSGTEAAYAGNFIIDVAASPAGGGTVGGGGTFAPGSTNTVTAAPNAGYIFSNWTQGGIVASTSPEYTFIVNGGGTLAANFVLPQYSLTVSSYPLDGGSVSGGGFFPAGSAQTVTATPAPDFQFVSWTGTATGTNNPLTFALNGNMNVTANFIPVSSNITLTVTTNGNLGRVTPDPNGRAFRFNQLYTLTATASPGNLFSNWTGSITTNRNPLTLRLDSSKVIQANFVANPFIPARGTYNGLFTATNAVIDEQTAGMLKGLAIGPRGAYSGTIMIDGAAHGFSGEFALDSQATNRIPRPTNQGGPLLLEMTLNPGNPPQITGTISGTTTAGAPWLSTNLTAGRATNVLPSAEYTINIPPDTNNPSSNSIPGGTGYALVTNHNGTVRMTGGLADGTPFSQTVPATAEGNVPVYANLNQGKGLLLGWISLADTNAPGTLNWIRPNAFTSTNPVLLSPWSNPPPASALPTSLFEIEFTNGIVVATSAFVLTFNTSYKLGEASGPIPLSGAINPKTGQLTVSFGSGAARQTGYAALLLNSTNNGGYFISKTSSGLLQLTP